MSVTPPCYTVTLMQHVRTWLEATTVLVMMVTKVMDTHAHVRLLCGFRGHSPEI